MESDAVSSKSRRRLSLSAKEIQSGAAAELILLINEITEDGKITQGEADQLRDWLSDGRLSEFPGIIQLKATLNKALEDGVVTGEETDEIFSVVLKVLPPDIRSSVVQRKRAITAAEKDDARKARQAQLEADRLRKEEEREEARKYAPLYCMDFMVAGCSYSGRSYTVDTFAEVGSVVTFRREPIGCSRTLKGRSCCDCLTTWLWI